MTRNSLLLAGLLFCTIGASAQSLASESPSSADEVVKSACKEATTSHKKVFLLFHASWCGWCHQMDSIMAMPACKQLFADHYVIRHLVIMESAGNKSLENPGALELYTKYAGKEGQGIPFWLVIDGNGAVVADSRIKPDGVAPGSTGNNAGCPSDPDEVVYFLKVLHATSPLSADQLHTIGEVFSKHKG